MPTPKPLTGRRNLPLYLMLPPPERKRLDAFAERIERPLSWIVRDALRVYLDAVEGDAGKVEGLRAPRVDMRNAGRTPEPSKGGRPRKLKGNVR